MVVTNRFGTEKTDLSHYSRNIVITNPNPEDLAEGIARAVLLQEDDITRSANYRSAGLQRDWNEALSGVVEQVRFWMGQ